MHNKNIRTRKVTTMLAIPNICTKHYLELKLKQDGNKSKCKLGTWNNIHWLEKKIKKEKKTDHRDDSRHGLGSPQTPRLHALLDLIAFAMARLVSKQTYLLQY